VVIDIQDHKERVPMIVMKMGHYPIVLGIPWMRLYNVEVQFASKTVTFGSQYCIIHCHDAPDTVQGVMEKPQEPVYKEEKLWTANVQKPSHFGGNIVMLNGASFFRTVKKETLTIFNPSLCNINKAIDAKDQKK
jgi:hypothetical protein